jgi:EAL domain-containing protein (putative c-di-GMP-specific phosphodiesterase class I)
MAEQLLSRSGALSYPELKSRLSETGGVFSSSYDGLTLTSHFQPIVSLDHARIIGHEGLLRAQDESGRNVPPGPLLARAEAEGRLLELDRLARILHIANGKAAAASGWLFLNMPPAVLAQASTMPGQWFIPELLADHAVDPAQIVIEIVEESIDDLDRLADRVNHLRQEKGYLLAIDDFGAGHSNFDRIWKIAPEIVKLDISFARQIETDRKVRRLLPQIVALLHEAEAFVLLEGIETETQALIAHEANVDLAQGYYFARPAPQPLPVFGSVGQVERLWAANRQRSDQRRQHARNRLTPLEVALSNAALRLGAGEDPAMACRQFLALPGTEVCYQTDLQGYQLDRNIWSSSIAPEARHRFGPIAGINGACLARRPYFHHAVDDPGRVHVSRSYLSVASGRSCVTLSILFQDAAGREGILCGDVAETCLSTEFAEPRLKLVTV